MNKMKDEGELLLLVRAHFLILRSPTLIPPPFHSCVLSYFIKEVS